MASRIYRIAETVDGTDEKKIHLVDAVNQSKALKKIVEPRFTVDIPSMQEVIDHTKDGVEVVKA